MVIKEFKKILTQKWIIYLLLILCFINAFLDIRGADEEKNAAKQDRKAQIEKNENYAQYIDNIRVNADTIATFSVFHDESNYQSKSAKKIVQAYDSVKDVKPVYGNYIAVEKVTDLGFCDVIVLLIILQCAIVLMNTDRKYGMLILLKSCRKGREKLALGKVGALFLTVFFTEVIVFFIRFLSLTGTYGCGNLMAPIQSVPDFYESALPVNILTYLILFVILKIFSFFSCAIFIFLLAVLCKNNGLIYALSGVMTGISVILALKIQWDYSAAIFKIMSPATLIHIKSVTSKYYNVNILGTPFNVMSVGLIVMGIYAIAFMILSVALFKSKITWSFHPKKLRFRKKHGKMRIHGMLALEFKKLLVTNRGIVILFILCIVQGVILTGVNTSIEGTQKYYSNYMNDLEGPQSEDTEKYIQDEKDYYEEVKEKYQEKQVQFTEGKISDAELMIAEDEYEWDMMPYEAFSQVLEQREYLNQLEENKSIKGWYVNDIGMNYLIHPDKIYEEKIAWIFMMLTMILLVVVCMAYEEQTGMDRLSDTTLYGGAVLLKKKIKVSGVISLITFLISNVPFLVLVMHSYDFGGIMAPVNSLRAFEGWVQMPILAVLILVYLVKLLLMTVATTGVMVISCKISGMLRKIAISITIFIIPLIIMVIL